MIMLEYFHHDAIANAFAAGVWLAAGVSIGVVYFLSLRWNVELLATGRSPLRAILLQLARFTGMAGILAVIALKFGALPLLVSFLGVVVSRTIVVRRQRGS